MSPLRKHPIKTLGKRDKGKRKGKVTEGSSVLPTTWRPLATSVLGFNFSN